jgi:hypothetical protein
MNVMLRDAIEQQLPFENCRFCHAYCSVEDEHHCIGLDRSRSESWSRIYRCLSRLAEWFEIDPAPKPCARQLFCAKVIRDRSWRRVWTVEIRCRKCGSAFSVCEPPGHGDDPADICEHRDRCLRPPVATLVKRPRGRRRRAGGTSI